MATDNSIDPDGPLPQRLQRYNPFHLPAYMPREDYELIHLQADQSRRLEMQRLANITVHPHRTLIISMPKPNGWYTLDWAAQMRLKREWLVRECGADNIWFEEDGGERRGKVLCAFRNNYYAYFEARGLKFTEEQAQNTRIIIDWYIKKTRGPIQELNANDYERLIDTMSEHSLAWHRYLQGKILVDMVPLANGKYKPFFISLDPRSIRASIKQESALAQAHVQQRPQSIAKGGISNTAGLGSTPRYSQHSILPPKSHRSTTKSPPRGAASFTSSTAGSGHQSPRPDFWGVATNPGRTSKLNPAKEQSQLHGSVKRPVSAMTKNDHGNVTKRPRSEQPVCATTSSSQAQSVRMQQSLSTKSGLPQPLSDSHANSDPFRPSTSLLKQQTNALLFVSPQMLAEQPVSHALAFRYQWIWNHKTPPQKFVRYMLRDNQGSQRVEQLIRQPYPKRRRLCTIYGQTKASKEMHDHFNGIIHDFIQALRTQLEIDYIEYSKAIDGIALCSALQKMSVACGVIGWDARHFSHVGEAIHDLVKCQLSAIFNSLERRQKNPVPEPCSFDPVEYKRYAGNRLVIRDVAKKEQRRALVKMGVDLRQMLNARGVRNK